LITFSLTASFKPTQNRGWIHRRFNAMLRDLQYGIMHSMLGTEFYRRAPYSIIHGELNADLSTYTLLITMPAAGKSDYHKIAHYLAKSKKNYCVLLTHTTEPDTIPPCDSHPETSPTVPPPATSATC
jgi:hypothetical protein